MTYDYRKEKETATIMGEKCKGILDPQIYRIKKITQGSLFAYYPQKKYFGLFWVDELVGFGSYEEANEAYCDYLRDCMKETVVEYFEVKCKE
jgi:hypothetical protein